MRRRAFLFFALLFIAAEALARVGGGESYSGGGSSGGGGGGGGGGGELLFYVIRFLFWLTIHHPSVGIPVDVIVLVGGVLWWRRRGGEVVTRIATSRESARTGRTAARPEQLRKFDPNFSEITFNDFCDSLYAAAHAARGAGDVDRYAPYLSALARNGLRARNPAGLREVRGIVIGSAAVTSFRGIDTPQVSATVVFESNFTEVSDLGENSWYVREEWVFSRGRDVLSPPPQKAKADHCPRCGAALQTRTDGSCDYCGVKIENGSFQWFVTSVRMLERQKRGPLLTSNVPERGTDRPTRFQHRFVEQRAAFLAAHPGFDWAAFQGRVVQIAVELQNAWTARDWERVRPLETESLFQTHRYWIDAYLRQKLRNIVADYEVGRVEPVKIVTDAFYEAITVRIYAQGRDHTVDESGRVVAGSQTDLRRWSEYWTLVRTRSASTSDSTTSCPNCGARVAVGATGVCEFCGGKLTAGSFDWLLSRIEQDEAYEG